MDEYHFNTLSLARTLELFGRHGFAGEAVHVGSFLRWRFGCERTHNPNAYTLILGREGETPAAFSRPWETTEEPLPSRD